MNKILQLIDSLASSYWFIPSIMALTAFYLALYLTQTQWILEHVSLKDFLWALNLEAEGARTVMATVAGSMITVAGVTFSITISSIVHATNQFGPRLLTNFMNDRGNQVTLGVFISTFLYCLVVLSTIPGESKTETHLVPIVAVIFGVALAIASVAVLIYFVHHVPASIHASHVISSVGKQLLEKVETLYVERDSSGDTPDEALDDVGLCKDTANLLQVSATFTGYLQFLDFEALAALASEKDIVIILNVSPGDFINKGDFLAWTYRFTQSEEEESRFRQQLREAFLCGDRRTPAQDSLFLANELIEIAARALSPGISDPFTAMMCMDWLGASFAKVANREHKQQFRHDDAGALRVVVPTVSDMDYVSGALGKLMPYACRDRNAVLHLQSMLAKLMLTLTSSDTREKVRALTDQLMERARVELSAPDVALLEARDSVFDEISDDADENAKIYNNNPWICRGV